MLRFTSLLAFCLFSLTGFISSGAFAEEPVSSAEPKGPQYAVALHGSPKYPADFKHLDYVNPDAPKGGTLRAGVIGMFDSLNPFVVKGNLELCVMFQNDFSFELRLIL